MTTMQVRTFLKVAPLLPRETSVLLRGNHGIGKSQVVRQVAKHFNLTVIDRRLSQMSEGDMIGLPTTDGDVTRFAPPDWYIRACREPVCLFFDELNRSNFDRAFGQLFTVLSGSAVVLPYKRKGQSRPLSLVPAGVDPPDDTDVIRVPANWRIIATMNVFDKNLLFEMSYALMRRFAFIEVGTPPMEKYQKLLERPGGDIGIST